MRVIGGGGCHVLLLQAVVLGTPHIGIAAFSCCSGCRGQGVVEEEGAAAASHGGRRGSRVREISQKWKGSVVADTAQSSSKATGRAYHLRISSSQGLHRSATAAQARKAPATQTQIASSLSTMKIDRCCEQRGAGGAPFSFVSC